MEYMPILRMTKYIFLLEKEDYPLFLHQVMHIAILLIEVETKYKVPTKYTSNLITHA